MCATTFDAAQRVQRAPLHKSKLVPRRRLNQDCGQVKCPLLKPTWPRQANARRENLVTETVASDNSSGKVRSVTRTSAETFEQADCTLETLVTVNSWKSSLGHTNSLGLPKPLGRQIVHSSFALLIFHSAMPSVTCYF